MPPDTPNALTQIAAFRAVLASANSSDQLKSYDLVWLMHLVGYRSNATKIARQRVALAGARLAKILNTELK